MKQKLNEVRTLAVKLFKAGQKRKKQHCPSIWGENADVRWQDLPSESEDIWDAVALRAIKNLRKFARRKPNT